MSCGPRVAKVVPRSVYARPPEIVARALLGKVLVHERDGERLAGRIAETEAYLGSTDPASHAFSGRSVWNEVLFGTAGYADVYLIYGLHYCMNISCLPDGEAGGVLLRALVPLEGAETMARLRGLGPGASAKSLAGGPGRLCQALGITRATHHGLDVAVVRSPLRVEDDGYEPAAIRVTPRIGIRKAMDLPLRFVME